MSIRSLGWITLSFCSIACVPDKITDLESDIDSLRHEISLRNNLVLAMNEETGLLDSLYDSHALNILIRRVGQSNEQVHSLKSMLRSSEEKYDNTYKKLLASNEEASGYHLLTVALQDEVSLRDDEIHANSLRFKNNIEAYRQNELQLKKEVEKRDQELKKLQMVVDEMKKMDLANQYFIKAQNLEHKAQRIFFAPRKKRESLKEALELYRKSYVLGKSEAQHKIHLISKAFKQ